MSDARGGPNASVPALRSLSEILSFLYDLNVDPAKVCPQDINFTYSAMFQVPWTDTEIEALRIHFLGTLGAESGRCLCRYALHHHPVRFSDGFTDDDLDDLLDYLIMAMIMVLHHPDLAPKDFSNDLAITEGGFLWARLRQDGQRFPAVRALHAVVNLPFVTAKGVESRGIPLDLGSRYLVLPDRQLEGCGGVPPPLGR